MNAEKVLILTMGTSEYKKTKYSLPESNEIMESELMAEPIAKYYRPDRTYMIGSVRSSWHNVYKKFSMVTGDARKEERETELERIEREYGIDTSREKLDEIEKRINDIFEADVRLTYPLGEESEKECRIEVMLIRYGIDEDQLMENYERIVNKLENDLRNDVHYEIAFDVTHSFRSMPIYNMVVLDYFVNVSGKDISFERIYYGNFDASREIKDHVAPIVDMKKLVKIMDITRGIEEFKNTGNSISLQNKVEDERLKQLLRGFDEALQLNEMKRIISALGNLLEYTNASDDAEEGPYRELKKMLREMLLRDLISKDMMACVEEKRIRTIEEFVECQFILMRWYRKTGRFGSATTTAMEAMKSLLAQLYLMYEKKEGNDINLENILEENTRRASVQRLCNRIKNIDVEYSSAIEYSRDLVSLIKKVKPIRNAFAHNLMVDVNDTLERTDDVETIQVGGADTLKCTDDVDAIQVIDNFIEKLEELRVKAEDRNSDFTKFYVERKNKRKRSHSSNDARVVIRGGEFFSELQADMIRESKSNKKRHDVYVWDMDISKYIYGAGEREMPITKIYALRVFLENMLDEYDSLHIVFYVVSREVMNLVQAVFAFRSDDDLAVTWGIQKINEEESNQLKVDCLKSTDIMINLEKVIEKNKIAIANRVRRLNEKKLIQL